MGAASAKASVVQNITNNTLNQTDLSSVNSTTMETAISTLVQNASICSSAVDQNNTCSMAGADIGGDLDFNAAQNNVAQVNFSCVQANKAAADMGNSMAQALAGKLDALNGTTAASALNAAASAQASMGLGVGAANSTSNVQNNITNNVTNQTKVRIENVFKNSLKNNFSSKTVSECIGKTTQANKVDLSGVKVGKNAKVNCQQTNTLAQVQECKQLNEAINKTMQETAQKLGFKVKQTNVTKSESKATGEATSTATVSMFAGGCGSLCCICIIIIICCLVAKGGGMAGGGKSNLISDGFFASSDS